VKHQHTTRTERAEIIELVRKSPLSIQDTLASLGVARSTYYGWCRSSRTLAVRRSWNKLLEQEEQTVLAYAHTYPDQSSRELAWLITDQESFSVSESTVYRLLKRYGLISPAAIQVAKAAKTFHRKTTRVHELWQTDLTYFFIVGWGWYYVGGILDDYSRYLIHLDVVPDMTGPTLTDLVQQAVEITGLRDVPVEHKTTLLSDNGSGYISEPFNDYLRQVGIQHVRAAPLHPQTCGKYERLNRTAKDKLGLVIYTSPEQLRQAVSEFHRWYNHQRYHEALGNLRPVDVYFGRAEQIRKRRRDLQKQTLHQRWSHNRNQNLETVSAL
jgi:putative transposase